MITKKLKLFILQVKKMPEVVLLGGASNAGKTTVATRVALESKGRVKVFDYFELALKM